MSLTLKLAASLLLHQCESASETETLTLISCIVSAIPFTPYVYLTNPWHPDGWGMTR